MRLSCFLFVAALNFTSLAFASDTVTCESNGNDREFCRVRGLRDADVTLERQLSKTKCREGDTWGVSDRGIWVDDGCRAVFRVEEYRRGSYRRGGRDDNYRDDYRDDDYRRHEGRRYDRNDDDRRYGRRHEGRSGRGGPEDFRVREEISASRSWVGPHLQQGRVNKVRVYLRRLNPNETDTHVSVGLDNNHQIGAQQVDSERLHWLEFSASGLRPEGRKIVVTSHKGSVYVDKVVVE